MSTTDSVPVTGGPVDLPGVWIHDPVDPQNTILRFRFGRAQRSSSTSVDVTEMWLDGRERPLVEWSEHTSRSYDVTIDLPLGETPDGDSLLGQAEQRRPLTLRDGRGRKLTGHMNRTRVRDTNWGQQATFTLIEIDN